MNFNFSQEALIICDLEVTFRIKFYTIELVNTELILLHRRPTIELNLRIGLIQESIVSTLDPRQGKLLKESTPEDISI